MLPNVVNGSSIFTTGLFVTGTKEIKFPSNINPPTHTSTDLLNNTKKLEENTKNYFSENQNPTAQATPSSNFQTSNHGIHYDNNYSFPILNSKVESLLDDTLFRMRHPLKLPKKSNLINFNANPKLIKSTSQRNYSRNRGYTISPELLTSEAEELGYIKELNNLAKVIEANKNPYCPKSVRFFKSQRIFETERRGNNLSKILKYKEPWKSNKMYNPDFDQETMLINECSGSTNDGFIGEGLNDEYGEEVNKNNYKFKMNSNIPRMRTYLKEKFIIKKEKEKEEDYINYVINNEKLPKVYQPSYNFDLNKFHLMKLSSEYRENKERSKYINKKNGNDVYKEYQMVKCLNKMPDKEFANDLKLMVTKDYENKNINENERNMNY